MQSLAKVPGIRIAGVCDILEKDLNALPIGNRNHRLMPMTVAACQPGKDVDKEC